MRTKVERFALSVRVVRTFVLPLVMLQLTHERTVSHLWFRLSSHWSRLDGHRGRWYGSSLRVGSCLQIHQLVLCDAEPRQGKLEGGHRGCSEKQRLPTGPCVRKASNVSHGHALERLHGAAHLRTRPTENVGHRTPSILSRHVVTLHGQSSFCKECVTRPIRRTNTTSPSDVAFQMSICP
jgi:hypothetical protein